MNGGVNLGLNSSFVQEYLTRLSYYSRELDIIQEATFLPDTASSFYTTIIKMLQLFLYLH